MLRSRTRLVSHESHSTENSWLRDHLLHDHGRTEEELAGMPLADLHRFEHLEAEMGLTQLSHHHPAPLLSRAR